MIHASRSPSKSSGHAVKPTADRLFPSIYGNPAASSSGAEATNSPLSPIDTVLKDHERKVRLGVSFLSSQVDALQSRFASVKKMAEVKNIMQVYEHVVHGHPLHMMGAPDITSDEEEEAAEEYAFDILAKIGLDDRKKIMKRVRLRSEKMVEYEELLTAKEAQELKEIDAWISDRAVTFWEEDVAGIIGNRVVAQPTLDTAKLSGIINRMENVLERMAGALAEFSTGGKTHSTFLEVANNLEEARSTIEELTAEKTTMQEKVKDIQLEKERLRADKEAAELNLAVANLKLKQSATIAREQLNKTIVTHRHVLAAKEARISQLEKLASNSGEVRTQFNVIYRWRGKMVDRLKKEASANKASIAQLKAKLTEAETSRDSQMREAEKYKGQLHVAMETVRDLADDVSDTNAKCELLQRQLETASSEHSQQIVETTRLLKRISELEERPETRSVGTSAVNLMISRAAEACILPESAHCKTQTEFDREDKKTNRESSAQTMPVMLGDPSAKPVREGQETKDTAVSKKLTEPHAIQTKDGGNQLDTYEKKWRASFVQVVSEYRMKGRRLYVAALDCLTEKAQKDTLTELWQAFDSNLEADKQIQKWMGEAPGDTVKQVELWKERSETVQVQLNAAQKSKENLWGQLQASEAHLTTLQAEADAATKKASDLSLELHKLIEAQRTLHQAASSKAPEMVHQELQTDSDMEHHALYSKWAEALCDLLPDVHRSVVPFKPPTGLLANDTHTLGATFDDWVRFRFSAAMQQVLSEAMSEKNAALQALTSLEPTLERSTSSRKARRVRFGDQEPTDAVVGRVSAAQNPGQPGMEEGRKRTPESSSALGAIDEHPIGAASPLNDVDYVPPSPYVPQDRLLQTPPRRTSMTASLPLKAGSDQLEGWNNLPSNNSAVDQSQLVATSCESSLSGQRTGSASSNRLSSRRLSSRGEFDNEEENDLGTSHDENKISLPIDLVELADAVTFDVIQQRLQELAPSNPVGRALVRMALYHARSKQRMEMIRAHLAEEAEARFAEFLQDPSLQNAADEESAMRLLEGLMNRREKALRLHKIYMSLTRGYSVHAPRRVIVARPYSAGALFDDGPKRRQPVGIEGLGLIHPATAEGTRKHPYPHPLLITDLNHRNRMKRMENLRGQRAGTAAPFGDSVRGKKMERSPSPEYKRRPAKNTRQLTTYERDVLEQERLKEIRKESERKQQRQDENQQCQPTAHDDS